MTTFTETRHPAEFIIDEEEMSYSREVVTVKGSGAVLRPGTVLGKITVGGKYEPSPATGATGSETGVAILIYGVDATGADVTDALVFVRQGVVNANLLAYDTSVDSAGKIVTKLAELKAAGIVAR
jgi:hypothetical protein